MQLKKIIIHSAILFPALCMALFRPAVVQAQAVDSAHLLVRKIILIGDAGALAPNLHHPVVEAVEKLIPMDTNTTVVYLGDNLYRHGLPDEQMARYAETRAVLDSQANIADHTPGMVYFIPGNHDWMNGQPGGWAAVQRQQRYINSLGKKNLKFLPEGGCPGPEAIDLGNDVVLVIMDSQWWIHDNEKPGIESDCSAKTETEVLSELRDIVAKNYRKLLIFACHHPFQSNGIHGGYYGIKQHIFPLTDIRPNAYIPLPLLGSVYPISRGVFGTPQDLAHPRYQHMIDQVDAILKDHPNVIHVAGHEHSLQWITRDSSQNYIISGSGCKSTRAQKSRRTKFVASSQGFAVLEVFANKDVSAQFYTAASPDSIALKYEDHVLNYSHLPPMLKEDTTIALKVYRDSVLAPASVQYRKFSRFKAFFAGHNYRAEWSEPVMFRTFRIRTEKGGMRILGAGGGMQTKSLQLVDKTGKEWVIRTIDKDPARAVPDFLRASLAENVVQDMISAGHPYAPLVVPGLASAAGVLHTNPTFFYVPDDYALGLYRTTFANKIVLLEERNPMPDGSDTKTTNRLFEKMREDNDQVVEQRAVLQARLLDILIGDWDRHFDQWRWGSTDTGKGKLYFPIPRDRDQAFFNSDGFLLRYASRKYLPFMRGFKGKLDKISYLGFSARDFDRIFMNALDERQWQLSVSNFTASITDSVINNSVSKLPPPIRTLDSSMLASKMIRRRDQLPGRALQFYKFLSKTVTILGSNEQEYFTAKGTDTGILLQVHTRQKAAEGGDTNMLIYNRTIHPGETKEVRVYGFAGNDYFNVDESVRGKVRFRFIGGRGTDTFDMRGHVRNDLYDLSTEPNPILAHNRTHNHLQANPDVNLYKLPDYRYLFERFPWINLGYNPDDGVLVGLGLLRRTFGFRSDPFKTEHRLQTLYSVTQQAFQIRYTGTYNRLLDPADVQVHASWLNPALTNFFGLGNETVYDDKKPLSYYRARYNVVDGDALLRYRTVKVLTIAGGPAFTHYWNRTSINNRKILENPSAFGLDSARLYEDKTYLGGRGFIDVNNLNSELLPTRGIYWHNELNVMRGIGPGSHPLTSLESYMNIYASLAQYSRLTAVIRLGGGQIFSKNYEWFQALGLGQNNALRGFRKNRFTGNSLAYGGLELRAKIADINSHILPGAIGVLFFDDAGRVWVKGEQSKRWHNSYGGGVYFLPFNQVILAATVGFSEEKKPLLNISLGTRLNVFF